MKNKALISAWILCLCLLCVASAFSQTVTVKGKVTAEGAPLPGVSVRVKGNTAGTTTNANGEFSLTAASNATLVFTSIGYKTKEVPIEGRTYMAESLEIQSRQLQDVVVLGYQTATKKSVTTSIASVSAKDIESYSSGTVATAIQGKLPGVQVMASAGTVGAQPRILIRGFSSLTGNTNPLVIVDGMEIGYNNMNTINPADIESIDVLKDASASSIYGARGASGVILITTKKGKGQPAITFSSTIGATTIPKVKLADAQEYARVMNQIATNSGSPLPFEDTDNLTNTDYWDLTYQDGGMQQNYNIGASGGREGLSLYGNLGYYGETSAAGERAGKWRKITARINADADLGKVFKLGLNVAPRYENYPHAPVSVNYYAMAMDPTVKPYRTEEEVMASLPELTGEYADFMTAFNPYYSLPSRSNFNAIVSPEFYLRTNFNKTQYFGGEYGAYLEARPIPNLVLKTAINGVAGFTQANDYAPKYFLATNARNTISAVSSETTGNSRFKITNTANYVAHLNEHTLDALVGQSYDKYTNFGTMASRQDIPFDEEIFRTVDAATGTITEGRGYLQPGASLSGSGFGGKMLSFFGSVRYNFKERYYLTGTMRADASSLVNPQYRWGYFPSVGGAWVISDESFFEKLGNTVNYLKIRADWGQTGGNLPDKVAAYITTVGPHRYVDANGNIISGYIPANIANPEIKWELNQDFNVGLDAAFFKDKLNFSFDTYVKKANNLLLNVSVDPTLGYPQGYIPTQLGNVGKMTTKGWELAIGYRDNLAQKIRFGAQWTLGYTKSIVDYLSSSDPILGFENNDVITTLRSRTTVGHEPGVWWGYHADGVFQTDEEAAAYVNSDGQRLQPKAVAGDLKFRDFNGDGKIDNNDLSDLGSPYPKFTSGLTLTLGYGNFDFRTEFYGAFGQIIFNNLRRNMLPTAHLNFVSGFADQYWNGPGSTNTFPLLKTQDDNQNFTSMSTFFLEGSDFVKCNLLQLGYRIPPQLIKGIKGLRVFASVQNAFVITGYSGLNPDVPWYSTVTYNGFDNYQTPTPRTYLFGVNLTL